MKSIGTQVLQTDRLILRRFVESDAEAMFQNWASSAENLTYVTWDPHPDVEVTRNSIRKWVAFYANPNYYKWAICLKEKPEQVIGDISIVAIDENDSSCEIWLCARQEILGAWYDDRGLESCLGLLFYSSRLSRSQGTLCQSQSSFRSCHGEGWNVLSKDYYQWCRREKAILLILFIIR